MSTYDRYTNFRVNDTIRIVPYVEIVKQDSDYYEIYRKGKTRLDKISYDYYKDANYGWLILQANPSAGSMEYEIKDGTELRIPFPLSTALENYQASTEEYYKLYTDE